MWSDRGPYVYVVMLAITAELMLWESAFSTSFIERGSKMLDAQWFILLAHNGKSHWDDLEARFLLSVLLARKKSALKHLLVLLLHMTLWCGLTSFFFLLQVAWQLFYHTLFGLRKESVPNALRKTWLRI